MVLALGLVKICLLRYLSSKRLFLIFLFPFLKLLPESLQQPGVFTLPKEFCLLEPFIQKLQLFRVIRVIVVGDPGFVVLLFGWLLISYPM